MRKIKEGKWGKGGWKKDSKMRKKRKIFIPVMISLVRLRVQQLALLNHQIQIHPPPSLVCAPAIIWRGEKFLQGGSENMWKVAAKFLNRATKICQ